MKHSSELPWTPSDLYAPDASLAENASFIGVWVSETLETFIKGLNS